MPIYEYNCSKCGHIEAFQSITDAPLTRCPTCRSKVSKLISHSSFQLKGTGWYVTDYAGKGSGGPNGSAKDGSKEGSEKTESPGKTSDSGEPSASAPESTKKTKKPDAKTSGSGSKAA